MLLQSHDTYKDLIEWDPLSDQINQRMQRTAPSETFGPIQGHYVELNGRLVIFYRERGAALHLRDNDEDVELSGDRQVQLQRGSQVNTLQVTDHGTVIFSLSYQRPEIQPPLAVDPTPFVEEEHFDFGLFVYNVMNDPGRMARIYQLTTS